MDAKQVVAKTQRKHKRVETFGTYILKVLKFCEANEHKDIGVSKRCMEVMNSLVIDVFNRIASEASSLARKSKRNTIGKNEIRSAAKLVLNGGELFKHADEHATKAITKYGSDKSKSVIEKK